jgi:hypothetical protein
VDTGVLGCSVAAERSRSEVVFEDGFVFVEWCFLSRSKQMGGGRNRNNRDIIVVEMGGTPAKHANIKVRDYQRSSGRETYHLIITDWFPEIWA